MAINKPLFINSFQKGSQENANIGTGTMLGVENYTVKGVARLTKDTTKVSGSVVTDLPVYFANLSATTIFSQGDTGKVYKSVDAGTTWTDISAPILGTGKGLVFFDGVLYAFRNGNIDYLKTPYAGGGAWVQGWQTGLTGLDNCPFIYPNARGFYFGNGFKLGILRQQTTGTAIDPANPATYLYNNSIFQLPSIYEISCLSFLPPNLLMIGTSSSGIGNDPLIADIISWDTISLNLFGSPLRLFSEAGAGVSGVKQLINRNNVLYAVTGGNHAIFTTNGSTFNLVTDISLRTTSRFIVGNNTDGRQATSPIFLNPRSQAIAVMGNKLFTGVSTSILSTPAGYGLFPLGIWSTAFTDPEAIQCEFTISSGVVCSNTFTIGSVHQSIQGQLLIGWFDGTNYGIDRSDFTTFQTDANVVQIESEMMEIGTPLEPAVVTTIQLNIVRNLLPGQTITLYYRSGFDQAYTAVPNGSFSTATGNIQQNNSLKCTVTNIGTVKFLQLKIIMSTGAPNQAWTPEIRNVIIQ